MRRNGRPPLACKVCKESGHPEICPNVATEGATRHCTLCGKDFPKSGNSRCSACKRMNHGKKRALAPPASEVPEVGVGWVMRKTVCSDHHSPSSFLRHVGFAWLLMLSQRCTQLEVSTVQDVAGPGFMHLLPPLDEWESLSAAGVVPVPAERPPEAPSFLDPTTAGAPSASASACLGGGGSGCGDGSTWSFHASGDVTVVGAASLEASVGGAVAVAVPVPVTSTRRCCIELLADWAAHTQGVSPSKAQEYLLEQRVRSLVAPSPSDSSCQVALHTCLRFCCCQSCSQWFRRASKCGRRVACPICVARR
jgi:hypothetical protein